MTKKNQSGQSLVLLLFFVLMAMTFTVTAIMMTVVNSGSVTTFHNGIETRELADSGAENALLRLLRDPFYVGEEYSVGGAEIQIVVTGGVQKTISSMATLGDSTRNVEVLVDYTDNVLRIVNWKEIYN